MATTKTKADRRQLGAKAIRLLVAAVDSGLVDDQLEFLARNIRERQVHLRNIKARKAMLELNVPGTEVLLRGNLKPKYLQGYRGTVVDPPEGLFANTTGNFIYVDIGQRVRRHGPIVGVPASCVEAA